MMKEKNIECRVLIKLQHHGGQSHYSFFVYVFIVCVYSKMNGTMYVTCGILMVCVIFD